MDRGREEFGTSGFGLRQLGFQSIAQRQQLRYLRHDPLLLGEWWERDNKLLAAGESMTPGDIIYFAPGTRFETPTSSSWMDSFFGHAAIIESVSGSTITILNQNLSGSPVIRTTINLATLTSGSYSVYHAVPK